MKNSTQHCRVLWDTVREQLHLFTYYQNPTSFSMTLPGFRWHCVQRKHKPQTFLNPDMQNTVCLLVTSRFSLNCWLCHVKASPLAMTVDFKDTLPVLSLSYNNSNSWKITPQDQHPYCKGTHFFAMNNSISLHDSCRD